jgi:hypothetical protein
LSSGSAAPAVHQPWPFSAAGRDRGRIERRSFLDFNVPLI